MITSYSLPVVVKGALAGILLAGAVTVGVHFLGRLSHAKITPSKTTIPRPVNPARGNSAQPPKRVQPGSTRSNLAPNPRIAVIPASSLQGTNWIQGTPADCKVPFYQLKMSPQDLRTIQVNPRSEERLPGTFVADGIIYDPVGVRNRGDWARSWPKKSLKIFFDKDKPFEKRHALNLNSGWRDPAFIREPLAYHVYEACGAISLQTRMVRLHINGQFWGLYVEVEQPAKPFLSRNQLQGASIYKADSPSSQSDERNWGHPDAYARHYEKENRKAEGYDELHQFCLELERTTNVIDFFTRRVEVDKYINFLVATVLVQNWDCVNKNHFLVFDERGSKKWLVVPWDLDRTFGDHWRQYFTETQLPILLGTRNFPRSVSWNRMADRFLGEPTLRARFLDRLSELLEKEFTPEKLYPLIDRWEKDIAQDTKLDQERWGSGQSEELHNGILQVKLYIKERRKYLLAELPKLRRTSVAVETK